MSNSSETDAAIQRVLGLPAAERAAVASAILDCIDAENQDGSRAECRVLESPSHLIYLVEDEVILGVAVAHQRRKPRYWIERLG